MGSNTVGRILQERIRLNVRLLANRVVFAVALLSFTAAGASTVLTVDEAAKALPDKIDSLRALGPAQTPVPGMFEHIAPADVGAISHASRVYGLDKNPVMVIQLVRSRTDSGAYALLTQLSPESAEMKLGVVGIASVTSSDQIVFCKGPNLVEVRSAPNAHSTPEELLRFAQTFAGTLEAGDDDLPVLVRHLPNWQAMTSRLSYTLSLESLESIVPNQKVLFDAMSFEGNTQAVAANYGPSKLVIVEFATPQLAGDNDRRIMTKIEDLRNQRQTVPSAYRRVGNYSVFVFNAPDEITANQLIDQVKYEQVVQWLGDNPHWYEKAVREWAQTSAGVLLTVLKSSGLSLLACLGLGGAIGALLFRRRRALQKEAAVYSDAGGMVRLNLDEITRVTDPSRLLTDSRKR